VRAATFFQKEVAVSGTYLWQYSADLIKREGEGIATKTQGWVQPPGTPRVGLAYLAAWQATSNVVFLEAARETAAGLLKGQLRSGGWQHSIELDPELRRKIAYRQGAGGDSARNVSTFDDDSTQAALRFLAHLDATLGFADAAVHEAVTFGTRAVLKAQYPNGGWPQGFERAAATNAYLPRKASFPEEWNRQWPGSQQYWFQPTLNDNSLATIVSTLAELARIYQASTNDVDGALARDCRSAMRRAGDFLIAAQLPEPQPAWAQQYDEQMQPAWARKFEPPAVSGGESQGALETLVEISWETGERKYLEPIPRALAYLRRSRLADGKLARFYELKTNRPLYFTRDYKLTYDDKDFPTHYSFKVADRTAAIERDYERAVKGERRTATRRAPDLREVEEVVRTLDARGAWVEAGPLRFYPAAERDVRVIKSATFVRNLELLAAYLERR